MISKQIKLILLYFSIIFLFFFSIYFFQNFIPDFREYHCKKAGFTIAIPGKTEEMQDRAGTFYRQFDYTKVSSGNDYWKFMAICYEPNQNQEYTIPAWFVKKDENTLDSIKIVTEIMIRGNFISEKDVNDYSYPAKDFEFKILNRQAAKARVFTVDKKIYELVVIGNSKKISKKAPEFFNSFKLDE